MSLSALKFIFRAAKLVFAELSYLFVSISKHPALSSSPHLIALHINCVGDSKVP